jgi:PAS domain S-box-containing protein
LIPFNCFASQELTLDWFWISLILVCTAGVWAVDRLRIRKYSRRHDDLVALLDARTQELEKVQRGLERRPQQGTEHLTETVRSVETGKEERHAPEDRQRLALNISGLGVWEWKTVTDEISWSETVGPLFGLPPGSSIENYEAFRRLIHPDDLNHVSKAMEASLEQGMLFEVEHRVVWPDRSVHWVAAKGTVSCVQEGKPVCMTGVVMDITARKQAEQALRESTERSELIGRATNDALWDWNVITNEAWWNDRYYRLFGFDPEHTIPSLEAWLSKTHPDEKDAVLADFLGAVERGDDTWACEYRYLRADETYGAVLDRAYVMRNAEGRAVRILGAMSDITGRKRAEEALQESEERFRQIAENIQEVFWMTTVDQSKILYISSLYEQVWGRSVQSLYENPLSFVEAIHPDDVEAVRQSLANLTQQRCQLEYRVIRPDGTVRWVNDRAFPIRNAAGKVYRIVGSALDVTERKLAEEAMRRAEERYRSMVDNAVYGIYRSTLDGQFLDVNPALVTMLGYGSAEELKGVDLPSGIYKNPDDRNRLKEIFARTSRLDAVEVEWKRKDGSEISIRLSGRRVEEDSLSEPIFEGIVEDITDRKNLEEHLRQAQKMESVGLLAGGIAHDFNNLLTAINGYSELLLSSNNLHDGLRRELEEIRKAGDRAAQLTQQLLAFSRKQILQPQLLDLNAVVGNVDRLLRRLIGEDVELITVLSPDLGRIKADPGQVEQVIMNLAVNARDAMPKGGRLTIETANVELDEDYVSRHVTVVPGRYVLLAMSDTGVGMEAPVLRRIFEPFFTTKELGKGTGMGLSTVYGIVKQSGGYIWVYSEPGQGTSFKVYFPQVGDAAASDASRTQLPELARGSETILVVEDEETVRHLILAVLRRRGYQTLEARQAQEALEFAEKHPGPIHVMLTDVVMPKMSGRELANQLATLRPEAKILFMSGYATNAIIHHGVLDPGTAFLQKPFTPDALVRKIRQILDD